MEKTSIPTQFLFEKIRPGTKKIVFLDFYQTLCTYKNSSLTAKIQEVEKNEKIPSQKKVSLIIHSITKAVLDHGKVETKLNEMAEKYGYINAPKSLHELSLWKKKRKMKISSLYSKKYLTSTHS